MQGEREGAEFRVTLKFVLRTQRNEVVIYTREDGFGSGRSENSVLDM